MCIRDSLYPSIRKASSYKYSSKIENYKEQLLAKETQLKSNEKDIKEAKAAEEKAKKELKEFVGDSKTEGIYDSLLTAMQDVYKRQAYLYSSVRKHKMLGDLYLKHSRYLSAYHAYQKSLSGLMQLKTKEQQEVLYHTGLCLTRMFRFQEAKEFFKRS